MALGQFHSGFRADGAFQVQMQFRLGEGVEDGRLPRCSPRYVNLVSRQLRTAGVDPRRHPVRSQVG